MAISPVEEKNERYSICNLIVSMEKDGEHKQVVIVEVITNIYF